MSEKEKAPRPLPQPWHLTQPFWDGASDRKLLVQYDPEVGKFQFYPRSVSIYTGRRNLEWREVSGRGTLYSFTEIHVAPPGFEDLAPYMIGVVELEEGVRIMTPLHNITVEDAELGMKMRVCWQRLSDEITYPAFEPDR
jgi:uncharacterized OB-fold protein